MKLEFAGITGPHVTTMLSCSAGPSDRRTSLSRAGRKYRFPCGRRRDVAGPDTRLISSNDVSQDGKAVPPLDDKKVWSARARRSTSSAVSESGSPLRRLTATRSKVMAQQRSVHDHVRPCGLTLCLFRWFSAFAGRRTMSELLAGR